MVSYHREQPCMSVSHQSKNRRLHPHQTALATVGPCSSSKAKLLPVRWIACRTVGAETEAYEVSTGDAGGFESSSSTPPRNIDIMIEMACMIRVIADIRLLWLE